MLYALTLMAAIVLPAADEKDPLAGSWAVVSMKMGGRDNPDPDAKDTVVTFKDGKITIKMKTKEESGTYKVDASKKPATIDLVPNDGEGKGKTHKGIFTIDKGELKVCFAMPEKDRPKELSSKEGEETILIVLKKK